MADERKELDWDLSVNVPSKGITRKLRVTSSESVQAIIYKVASKLGEGDWSNFALWWPDKGVWLSKVRQTLYSYGIMSNSVLEFTCVQRNFIVELPDRTRYIMRIHVAMMTFYVVKVICDTLNIRHAEELSLMRSPFDKEGYVKATGYHRTKAKKTTLEAGQSVEDPTASPGHKTKLPSSLDPEAMLPGNDMNSGASIVKRLPDAPENGFFSDKVYRSATERAFINGLWLNSSKTLFEQEVNEGDLLYLRFRYYPFMDIDPRVDEARINQLYAQAKWSILVEEVDCTEEEVYTFAALQFQIKLAQSSPAYHQGAVAQTIDEPVTDINAAIDQLQIELGQTRDTNPAESRALQLTGYCKFSKGSRMTLKAAKRYFFLLKGTTLCCYKHEDSYTSGEPPLQRFNLTGAEAVPDLDLTKRKYCFNVLLPTSDENKELRLYFDTVDEYSSWMAGCRMAIKGRPLVKQGYEQELSSIKAFVSMQNTSEAGPSATTDELRPEDFVSPRMLKKHKPKVIARQILDAHSSMLNMSLMDAKMQYIRNWQALQGFGITYFVIKSGKSKKDEFLGIAYNRLILFDAHTMEEKNIWRYSAMRSWNVNWESKTMKIDHEQDKISFTCTSADLKIVHEFIGGNIWLSLRKSGDDLDVGMFVKLTGGVASNLEGWGAEVMAQFS
ncbi:PREDICTED: fermitin family homolog 2-like [Amphimedon queenslandica]|uniref:PH domain-containing protein n=1 Tax=Amphimedon queenslandica TaxID=400682 RepID=A0A1X7VDG3_AMPQE|nr:PREDICTED: fermitin family homolog 2-like [Amphimedon queenslandica]|eukprot:XP_003384623.1 PREDICTED: fermitin family homolog 2-like [Amphimedon queenslandica]